MTLRNALGNLALDANLTAVKGIVQAVRDRMDTRFLVGNARSKFRDGFADSGPQPSSTNWNFLNESIDPVGGIGTPGSGLGHIIERGGDAAGSSYLRISMSPFDDDCSFWLATADTFRLPTRLGFGVTVSQRILGQELFFGIVQAGTSDPAGLGLQRTDPIGEVPLTGNIVVTSNVGVVPLGVGHPFRSGDRVLLRGCFDTRLNVAPVIISSADATSISVPITIANGTYTATGGYVRMADASTRGYNAAGMLIENTTVTNATLVGRRNGSKTRMRNNTIATTVATANAAGSWHDSLVTPGTTEVLATMDETSYRSFTADSVTASTTGTDRFSQTVADEELDYRIVLRARNLDEWSRPIARITNISKSGTATATVTTDVPHGLTTGSRVGIAGVRDVTNFPFTTDQAVASTPTATTFTVVVGSATTASDANGGVVYINHGGVTSPGAFTATVQSIARNNNVLQVTFNTTATNTIGETYQLHGFNAAARAYEGAYRCVRLNGAVAEFESIGANVASITTGGACIRRTDYRIHFVRALDHTRHMVEVMGGRGSTTDQNNAVPTVISNTVAANINNVPTFQVRNIWGTLEPMTTTAIAAGATYTQSASLDFGTDVTLRPTRGRLWYQATAAALGSHATVVLQESMDGTTYRETLRFPAPADGVGHTYEVSYKQRYARFQIVNGPTAQTAIVATLQFAKSEGLSPDFRTVTNLPQTPVAGITFAASATLAGQVVDFGANHTWDRARLFVRNSDTAATTYTYSIQASFDGTNFFAIPTATATSVSATPSTHLIEALIAGFRYIRPVVTNNSATAGAAPQIATLALIPA